MTERFGTCIRCKIPYESDAIGNVSCPICRTIPICPHGDPTCPCPDGLQCHYEGRDAWPEPSNRA